MARFSKAANAVFNEIPTFSRFISSKYAYLLN